jgi:hypothetical protein
MATLSARGAHKVVALVFDVTTVDDHNRGETVEMTYALRSDGHVLRKTDFVRPSYDGSMWRQSGNYTLVTSKPLHESKRNREFFVKAITKMVGQEPVRTH